MNIYLRTQENKQAQRQWWGEAAPHVQEELLKLLPAEDQGYALAVQGSARNEYTLGLKLPGSAGAYVLAAGLEEPQARGLALAMLCYQDDLCRDLEASLRSPQATEGVQQILETYMSRTPVSREYPLFEGLDTSDAEKMIECLREKKFINGPGLKLLISERGTIGSEEVDLQLRYGQREHGSVDPKIVVAVGVAALLLLLGIYALVHRPKAEPVQENPAAAPAQLKQQAVSAPESDSF